MNVFDKAFGELETRGLAKYTQMERDTGAVCVYGALSVAQYGVPFHATCLSEEGHLLDKVALNLFPDRQYHDTVRRRTAATINNHPDSTQEDMLLVLKHASYEWNLLHPEEETS